MAVTSPEYVPQSPIAPEPRPKRNVALIVAPVIGVVALVAFATVITVVATKGSRATQSTPAAAATSDAPAAAVTTAPVAARYTTPAELQRALESNHIPCTGFTVVTGKPNLATADARCYNDDSKEVVLRIYANNTDAESQAALLSNFAQGTNFKDDLLVGDNWTIGGASRPWLARVKAYLGGHIVHIE